MKTKPYGVRFEKDLLEKIKEREGLTSPQQVVNYLMKWYEQMHFGIEAPAAIPASKITPELQKKQSEEGKGLAPEKPPTGIINKVISDIKKEKYYDAKIPSVSVKQELEVLREEILDNPGLIASTKTKLITRIEAKLKFLK